MKLIQYDEVADGLVTSLEHTGQWIKAVRLVACASVIISTVYPILSLKIHILLMRYVIFRFPEFMETSYMIHKASKRLYAP